MGSIYFSHRSVPGEAPTRITLPNPPLILGKRKELTALVPVYVQKYASESSKIPADLHFIHMATAVQSSRNEWLLRVLTEFPRKIPLRDEPTGITLLHIAAKSSDETTLNILLNKAEILELLDEVDIRGTSPLIVAAWYGNYSALKIFLALGCETSTVINDTKKNALHCAADLTDCQICAQLIKYNSKKIFIDAVDYEGNTPLMIAVRVGSPCVTTLLIAGVNYRYQNAVTGRNILHLAIVFFQKETLIKLLKAINDSSFISVVDFNGDTPFMLAIRLHNYVILKILIDNVSINKLLTNSENSIHYLIKFDDSEILEIILTAAGNIDFLGWSDSKGRTPLMFAVELQRTEHVRNILERDDKLWFRNPYNGETVLHIAAYEDNIEIMRLLLNQQGIDDIIDITDNTGRTAYEIVLGRANPECYYEFKENGFVIPDFVNSQLESSLSIAAKKGNYNIMLHLLLSDKFLVFHEEYPEFNKVEITRAALQGRLFSSDIFIISGATLSIRAWNNAPDQSYLFRHNSQGENIFHQCVKGENIMCLAFIYEYCVHFNQYWQEIDEPNYEGSTPLLLATLSGQADMFKYLVQHGADMTKSNLKGKFPLLSMTKHIWFHHQLLLDMITECVVKDVSERKQEDSPEVITISFRIFCPPGVQQLFVIQKMFEVLVGEEYSDILHNPVVEYMIERKWQFLKSSLEKRLKLNLLTVFFTYLYISVHLWSFSFSSQLIDYLFLPTLILSILSIFFNIPLLYTEPISWSRRLFSISIIVSPVCTLLYLYLDSDDKKSLEIGATAVLTGGISVFTHTIDTPLGHQVSMFYQVFQGIVSHLPLSFILLFSFSVCFFVLYHESFNFSTPIHSFIYTVMVLMEGESGTFPYFLESDNSRSSSQRYFEFHKSSYLVAFEALIMIMFKVLITLSMLNMLIGLSIRGAGELEKGGNIQRSRTKVGVSYEWESVGRYRCYQFLSKYKLQFLIGVLNSNLTKGLEIPMIIYPFEQPLKTFDINRIKNIAVRQEDIKSYKIKFLEEDVGYREVNFSLKIN